MSKSVSLKIPKMDKLLNDKNVLYAVFVIAILNVLGYLMTKNIEAVAFFLVIGFLTTYFSKNMIVVLIITIITTSIFASTRTTYVQVPAVKEGMSSKKPNLSSEQKNEIKDQLKEKKDQLKEKKENGTTNTEESSDGDMEVSSKVSTISNKKNGKENYVDYASTLETAYKNLQNTIGEGGVKWLTQQTGDLIEQQTAMMKNIETMQPFLKTADSFMKNLNLEGLSGVGDMLGKLTGKKTE